jgi:hypothetical protein
MPTQDNVRPGELVEQARQHYLGSATCCAPTREGMWLRSLVRVMLSVSLFAVWINAATSQTAGVRTRTPSGVAFDQLILLKVDEVLFSVPAAYLTRWPTPDMIGRINPKNSANGLSLMFWHPSKRPVEVRTEPPLISPQPMELGRPPPAANELVVLVNDLRFLPTQGSDYISPDQRFPNLSRTYSGAEDSFQKRHNLQQFRLTKVPSDFESYRQLPGTQPQVLLRCRPLHDRLPNPTCNGYVHFDADKLGFWLLFSSRYLENWYEIASAVRDLAYAWRNSAELGDK